jgi:hypothetical protein
MSFGILAAGIGGLLGASGNKGSSTQSQKMDPRMDRFVYGDSGQGGLLGDAYKLYSQQMAQGGMNPMMQAGLEGQRQFLTSPQYSQGYNNLMNLGQGLLGGGVAGNPFTQSQRPAQMPKAEMHPFMNGGFQQQYNPSLLGALDPIKSQGVMPSELSKPVTEAGQKSPLEQELSTFDDMTRRIFDALKTQGMNDSEALRYAKAYSGSRGV